MVMNKYCTESFYPQGLKPGDSIGIIAAGGRVDAETLEKGCSIISEHGFVPVVSYSIFEHDGYFAGSDRQRAESLMRMFLDPQIKAVVCARGGYGSMRIAGLIDYGAIASNKKIFMGFSDSTFLLSEIARRSGFVTWHGPMVTTLPKSDDISVSYFFKVLTGDWERIMGFETLAGVHGDILVEGISVCGNMTTFCHTAGTAYQPDWRDCVVFLEDINEPVYKIDRMLFQMKLASMFEGVRAVVLGDFTSCGPMDEIVSLFVREFENTGTSVIIGSGFGHGRRNIAMPFGAGVSIDCKSGTITWI